MLKGWPKPEIVDCEQGSDEWFTARLGLPTSSNFSCIVRGADSKTRSEYMRRLAGEVLTGVPAESYSNFYMQRGNSMELEARSAYERKNVAAVDQVGFVRRKLPSGRYVGASPDGLIGKRKALEIKTIKPELMIALLERGAGMPPEHRWQVYGTMFVADLEEVDLILFYRGMPVVPQFTIKRDEQVVKEISDAVEVFDNELWKLVGRIRKMG